MNPISLRKTLIASGIALALGIPAANAALVTNVWGTYTWSTDSANLTFLDPSGYTVGSANDVNIVWDGNAYNSITDYVGPGSASNVTASSTTPLYAYIPWVGHDIQMFAPGTYQFDTTLGGGSSEAGILTMNVGSGQLGMHMLMDWHSDSNLDVVVVFDLNSVFGSGVGSTANPGCASTSPSGGLINCLYDGPGYGTAGMPVASNPWMLASTDPDGDGIMGIPLPMGSPWQTFNINFNANLTPASPVPVPAAAWLFGSGLMGLLAFTRRRKRA